MARLDFSDILDDEDLGSSFDVIRRRERISEETGRSVVTSTTYRNNFGSVVPGDPHELVRSAEGQMTSRLLSVICKFRLRASGKGFQPDQIVYDKVTYTVKALKPWTQLGAGFVLAVAESEHAADPAP